jgi:hypothetical protein
VAIRIPDDSKAIKEIFVFCEGNPVLGRVGTTTGGTIGATIGATTTVVAMSLFVIVQVFVSPEAIVPEQSVETVSS